MSLLKQIREDKIAALKGRNKLAYTLLGTLEGDARIIGMNDGNRETSDAEVVGVVIKFIKGIDESLKIKPNDNLLMEKQILEGYLPKQLSQADLSALIMTQISGEKSPKQMGAIMAYLKQNYAGQYDGNLASKLVKQLLG